MSSSEPGAGVEFPHRREEVFKAIVVGVDNLPGMRVESEDPVSGQILIRTGVSHGKGEEKFPITVVGLGTDRTRLDFADAGTRGAMDPEKQRATMDKILRATSEALEAFAARRGGPETSRS